MTTKTATAKKDSDTDNAYMTLINHSIGVTEVHDDAETGTQVANLTEEGAKKVIEVLQSEGWKLTHG